MGSRLDRITDWEGLAHEVHYKVARLADRVGVTPRQLERYFLESFGLGPGEWLEALRLRRAQRLRAAGHSMKETAFEVGYRDSSSLWRLLHRESRTALEVGLKARNGEMSPSAMKCRDRQSVNASPMLGRA